LGSEQPGPRTNLVTHHCGEAQVLLLLFVHSCFSCQLIFYGLDAVLDLLTLLVCLALSLSLGGTPAIFFARSFIAVLEKLKMSLVLSFLS